MSACWSVKRCRSTRQYSFLLAWNGALPVHLSGKAAIADANRALG